MNDNFNENNENNEKNNDNIEKNPQDLNESDANFELDSDKTTNPNPNKDIDYQEVSNIAFEEEEETENEETSNSNDTENEENKQSNLEEEIVKNEDSNQETSENTDEHNDTNKEQPFNPYQHMNNNPYFQPNFDPNQQYPPYGYNPYNPYNPNMNNQFMQQPYVPPIDPRFNQNSAQMPIYPQPTQQRVGENLNIRNVQPVNKYENSQENTKLEDETYAIIKSDSNIRTFATIVSVLLVISVVSFVYYFLANSDSNENSPYVSNGTSPSLEMSYTPDYIPVDDGTGILTNNEIFVKISPSVVGIAVYTKGFGQVLQSEGSGIIMSEDGFVITNYHVIANDSSSPVVKIEVITSDGETYEARVIGGDSKTDLAVVKIDAVNLVAAEFGDSSKLKIGDRVGVIGNPSGIAFASSFTSGCVSALSRSIYMSDLNAEIEYIQTDAAINSGNSGGAFINEYGQIVGISAAKMRVEAGYEGMGFAIPINNAKVVIDSLIEFGYVAGRPRVGIEYKAISPTLAELNSIPVGLRVYSVGEDVDAHEKILPGDIITMFDGEEVYDSETVASALSDKRSGEELVVTVYRVDEETGVSEYIDITIILSESVGEKLAETMY